MPISQHKAEYFHHRYLDNYDMSRAIEKWNKGFPDDPTNAEEIEEFLIDLVNRLESGMGAFVALHGITSGTEPVTRLEVANPPKQKKHKGKK